MKNLSLNIILLFSLIFYSCGTIKVASDYDSDADFSKYKTYAFYKTGIDKVEISDIDKKRILKSIKNSLTTGWYPRYGRSYNRVAYTTSEGALYIDVIDTKSKQLIWQGKGIGVLSSNKANRDELIENFVNKIMEVYPPKILEK